MEVFDLSHFGWDGCVIPTDLKDICSKLPTWKNIKTLRQPCKIDGGTLYFPWKLIKQENGDKVLPGYGIVDTQDDGGYAIIYKARRALYKPSESKYGEPVNCVKIENFKEICIKTIKLNILPEEDVQTPHSKEKTYIEEISAILYEAFIHAIISKTLEKEGHPSIVPKLYEIVGNAKGSIIPKDPTDFESIWIGMEFLNGHTLERFLRIHLNPVPFTTGDNLKYIELRLRERNEMILLDIVIQLAYFLHILQTRLRFNHRDLKINNLFVRHHLHSENWKRTLTVPDIGTWKCINDIVLIDFGFSCIACGDGFLNPRATLIGAGSWFKSEHDCLKYGRDLGQFLYSLHCSFPFHEYVSPKIYGILSDLMVAIKADGSTVNLLHGFAADGTPLPPPAPSDPPKKIKFNNGIYYFLREKDVDIPGCKPLDFLRELSKLRLTAPPHLELA